MVRGQAIDMKSEMKDLDELADMYAGKTAALLRASCLLGLFAAPGKPDPALREKLEESRSRETVILASKTKEGQKKLFLERSVMAEEVFRLASDKLSDYTKTAEYREKLKESAKAIAEVFDGCGCVLYLNERDLQSAGELKAFFSGDTEVKADKSIKIGGLKGYCQSKGIIADETLDAKLEAQREWFVENAALSVL